MTKKEFLSAYHNYIAADINSAMKESDKVNKLAIGFKVEPVVFPDVGICLMLTDAKNFIKNLYPEIK